MYVNNVTLLFWFLCHLSQNPVIPSTVSDQVRLWEQERDRLSFSDGKCNSLTQHNCCLWIIISHDWLLPHLLTPPTFNDCVWLLLCSSSCACNSLTQHNCCLWIIISHDWLLPHWLTPPTLCLTVALLFFLCVGVLYSEFLSATDFEKVRKYAEVSGIVSWVNNSEYPEYMYWLYNSILNWCTIVL